MKKLLVTMLTILMCGAAFALPIGNPSDASMVCDGVIWHGSLNADPNDPSISLCDSMSVRIGFYGDYVFNHHLQVDEKSDDQIDHTEVFTNAGFVAINFRDRLDIFGTVGATNLRIESAAFTFGMLPIIADSGERLAIESNTVTSWSVGARGTLWRWGYTTLGIEGQYFAATPRIERVTLFDTISDYPSDLSAKYREWQVGLGISQQINMFVPYVAVRWGHTRLNFDSAVPFGVGSPVTLQEIVNAKRWGWAVGISILARHKASLTAEARYGDEKALYINGQVRF